MKQLLEAPVEYGTMRLAPTIELAGLAELADLDDDDARLDALKRIAAAVRAEDDARDHLRAMRSGEIDIRELPQRQR